MYRPMISSDISFAEYLQRRQQHPPTVPDHFLRLREVAELTGISKSHLYRLISKGVFPRPIKRLYRYPVWAECEVMDWLEQRTLLV